jgi:hypothetical protein
MATSFEELRALREAEIVADGILLKSPISRRVREPIL